MSDIVTPAVRSRMMSAIRGTNTSLEQVVRKALFAMGYRYRLHVKELPGKPDLVLPKHHAIVFIHGCFWHGHNCDLFRQPKTNKAFWTSKIRRNRTVDGRNIETLRKKGWRVLTVWECSLRGRSRLGLSTVSARTNKWLQSSRRCGEIRGKQ